MTTRRRLRASTVLRPPAMTVALALAVLLTGTLLAQEDDSTGRKRLLAGLTQKQQQSAEELRAQLDAMRDLAKDLRERGELDKASLLDSAIKMVTEQRIGVGGVANAKGTTHKQLVGLEHALRRMASLLEERGDAAAAEVQDLGKKVIGELGKIVDVLTGRNEAEDIERRLKEVAKARRTADEIADRQRKLRQETQRTVPRTEAEKIAERARRDIDELKRQVEELDRQAKSDLRDVDAARERAAKLNDLLNLQKRLRQETGVRAGDSDKVTPKANRLRAEMQSVARNAERNASEAGAQQNRRELGRQVSELAKRQEAIARQSEARAALEQARETLRRDGPEETREALRKAAEAMKQTDVAEADKRAADLEAAAKAMTPKSGRKQATDAIEKALGQLSSRETVAKDQETVARDVQRTLDKAATAKQQDALEKARERAAAAAAEMKAGKAGEKEAREAAQALAKAAQAITGKAEARSPKGDPQQGDPKQGEQKGNQHGNSDKGHADKKSAEKRAADHEAAARRASDTADKLEKLADDKDAQNAGLRQTAQDAAEAMRKAAEELKGAADAARAGANEKEQRLAEAAAERVARAERELKEALEEGQDLTERQGKVAKDLENLAQQDQARARNSEDRGGQDQNGEQAKAAQERARGMKAAAEQAKAAGKALKERSYEKAGQRQDAVLEQLEKMAKQADKAARDAAQRSQEGLQRAQAGAEAAARKAQELQRNLKQGARSAREQGARDRLDQAADAVKKSEEALRRSLRRLKAAMPKSAEDDRRDAKEKLDDAERALKGLRENHQANEAQQQRLRNLAKRQEQLREDVKRLEEHLKKTKQDSGRERLQDAESAMRSAQRAMEQGDVDEAEKAQERAEKALKEAQKDMSEQERRYRSLRQFELLFKLRDELRNFRRTAQGHRETLGKIDANVRQAGRVTRSIRRSEIKPLRKRVDALHRDMDEKAEAIRKEGAIVYSYLLGGCVTDLKEVESQLSLKETGLVPQELLGDVVRRLELAIRGLERDLKEKQKEQQNQQQQQQGQNQGGQQPGRTGPPRLVPADAEIRMVLVLQRELNKERQTFFDNRPDLGNRPPSPAEKSRLERMYHQQGSLAELFDTLRRSLVEGGQANQPDFGNEEDEGR